MNSEFRRERSQCCSTCAAFMFCMLAATTSCTERSSSVIGFDEKNIDVGSIAPGATIRAVFRCRNEGKVPVNIVAFQTSCTCTETPRAKIEVLPGSSRDVPIGVKPPPSIELLESPLEPHSFSQTVGVVFDRSPTQVLSLRGQVTPPIIVDQSIIRWDRTIEGNTWPRWEASIVLLRGLSGPAEFSNAVLAVTPPSCGGAILAYADNEERHYYVTIDEADALMHGATIEVQWQREFDDRNLHDPNTRMFGGALELPKFKASSYLVPPTVFKVIHEEVGTAQLAEMTSVELKPKNKEHQLKVLDSRVNGGVCSIKASNEADGQVAVRVTAIEGGFSCSACLLIECTAKGKFVENVVVPIRYVFRNNMRVRQ